MKKEVETLFCNQWQQLTAPKRQLCKPPKHLQRPSDIPTPVMDLMGVDFYAEVDLFAGFEFLVCQEGLQVPEPRGVKEAWWF